MILYNGLSILFILSKNQLLALLIFSLISLVSFAFISALISPLYILVSFVKDKLSIDVWIYLWVFWFVPLICISVFVPVPYCLDDCGFVVETEVRQIDSSSSILLSQDWFGYLRFVFFFCISIQIVKLFVLVL